MGAGGKKRAIISPPFFVEFCTLLGFCQGFTSGTYGVKGVYLWWWDARIHPETYAMGAREEARCRLFP